MNIKYGFKSIIKNKFLSLVLIIQLICIFVGLYNIIDYNQKIIYLSDKIEKAYTNRSIYRFATDDINYVDYYNNPQEVLDMVKDFSESNEYTFTITAPSWLEVKVFNGFRKFEYANAKNTPYETLDKEQYTVVNSFLVNENSFSTYDVQLDEGRFFTKDEYYSLIDGVLPVILGSDYKGTLNIGDKIEYYYGKKFFEGKVVGILKKNETMPIKYDDTNTRANGNVSPNDYKLNNSIIVPFGNNVKLNEILASQAMYHNFFIFNSSKYTKEEEREILEKVESIYEKTTGIKQSVKSFDKVITKELDKYKNMKDSYSLATIIAILFSTVTIIVAMLNSIDKRKKEFGVYIFSGATKKDIIKVVFFQMILIVILAFFISCIMLTIYFRIFEIDTLAIGSGTEFRSIKVGNGSIILIFGILYASLASIIPIRKIFKLDISELLRRDD